MTGTVKEQQEGRYKVFILQGVSSVNKIKSKARNLTPSIDTEMIPKTAPVKRKKKPGPKRNKRSRQVQQGTPRPSKDIRIPPSLPQVQPRIIEDTPVPSRPTQDTAGTPRIEQVQQGLSDTQKKRQGLFPKLLAKRVRQSTQQAPKGELATPQSIDWDTYQPEVKPIAPRASKPQETPSESPEELFERMKL